MGISRGGTFLLLFALALAACSKKTAPPLRIDTYLQQSPNQPNQWELTYTSSQPIHGLSFSKSANRLKHAAHKIHPEHMSWEEADLPWLRTASPVKEINLLFEGWSADITNSYPFMTQFSDGSAIVYSGHLDVRAIDCRTSCLEVSAENHFHFIPSAGGKVIVDTEEYEATASYSESEIQNGVFVLFSGIHKQSFQQFELVTDPQMPNWIKEDITAYLPKFLNLYGSQLGHQLPSRFFVSFAFDSRPLEADRTRSYGAVLGRHVQLALRGEAWNMPSPKRREQFLLLLAHEAFHLWNASLYNSIGQSGGQWLHEGGADAIAYLALKDVGYWGQIDYSLANTSALNRCMISLSGQPLSAAETNGDIHAYYHCGAFINFITADINGGQGLYALWAELFTRAQTNHGVYTHDMFTSVLPNYGWSVQANELAHQLLKERVEHVAFTFKSLLDSAGITYEVRTSDVPSWYKMAVGKRAIREVVKSDCGGRELLRFNPDYVELFGGSDCKKLNRDQKVSQVGPYHLYLEGDRAYDYVQRSCELYGEVGFVSFSGYDIIRMNCSRIAARPPYLSLLN